MTTAEGTNVKTIIDGRTYDTETATVLAVNERVAEDGQEVWEKLCVNRRGAFFDYSNFYWDENITDVRTGFMVGGHKKRSEYITALTVEEASEWAEQNGATLLEDYARYLGELPPEAGEEETAMTVRLTVGMKTKLERAGREKGDSLNTFVVGILEKAMEDM